MPRMRSARGQSMGEYAILFAIVLGAAIAMQQYVKGRIQGGTAGTATAYSTAAIGLGGFGAFEPERTTDSTSDSVLTMSTARAGTITSDSQSTTIIDKVKAAAQ